MTPFYIVVAGFPLALYFIALACLHWRSTPFAVDGRRDFLALAFALSGVFFVGPGQAAVPYGAALVWKSGVWYLCGALYFLVVVLISSSLRPKIVVYNATRDQLRKILSTIAVTLDDEARWAGSALNLPGLGVQFYLDDAGIGRVATLVVIGSERSEQGWARLETELTARLKTEKAARPLGRFVFAALGAATLALVVWSLARYPEEITSAFQFYMSV